MLLLALLGCVDSDLGKTIVYALEQEPLPTLDRDRCATGVGMRIPLGLTETIALVIAPDGADALVGSCALDGAGAVVACGTLLPEVRLLVDDGVAAGQNAVHVSFEGTNCTGATLENDWSVLPDDALLETTVQTRWRLDNTDACEDFESQILAASNNQAGIDGCEMEYAFEATKIARCDFSRGFADCKDP